MGFRSSDGRNVSFRKSIKRKLTPFVPTTIRQLKKREWLPAIVFMFSRKQCDSSVQELSDINLLKPEEQSEVFRFECINKVLAL